MKILIAHNQYRTSSPSGEDRVVQQEHELLRASGADVVSYTRRNDDIPGGLALVGAGIETVWSRRSYRELRALIRRERPDVVHFHNLWYSLSVSGMRACFDAGVPVVQTLHNFRAFCANGLLLREGAVCEACVGRMPWRGIAHGCYGSRLHSLPIVAAQLFHRATSAWTRYVDAFIALSGFARDKLVACGLPADRVRVKPNFFPGALPEVRQDRGYALFLGRLSPEKGATTLLEALRSVTVPALIVGDGPLRPELERQREAWGLDHVRFTGRLPPAECLRLLSEAAFLVLPSACYENFPMSMVEAYACARPVIASRLGSLSELVEDGRTGLLFEPGSAPDLARQIARLASDAGLRRALGTTARATVEQRFTPDRNLALLLEIYRGVLRR